MRHLAMALGTILIAHALAGVSAAGAQTSGAQPGKGNQTAGVHACSLLSDADIVRVTGKPNHFKTPPETSEMPNGSTGCNFVGVDLTLTPGMTAQTFDINRKQAATGRNVTVEPVAGVGDEAYFYVRTRGRSNNNVGIVFRRGRYQIAMGELTHADSIAWFKPKLVELAKLAATKLR